MSQERKQNILAAVAKLQSYHEIQNLMGRAIVALNFRQPDRVLSLFATSQDDVSFEYADEGLFVGKEAVTALVDLLIGSPAHPGEMRDYHLTTPIIEVAEDGQSARAVWWVPGAGAVVEEGKEPEAIWDWHNIGADFILEEGKWKIWHLHFFRYITCSYDKGWTEDVSMVHRPNTALHPLAQPTTFHNPYTPMSVRDGIPAAPRPYDTANGTGWMLSRDKS